MKIFHYILLAMSLLLTGCSSTAVDEPAPPAAPVPGECSLKITLRTESQTVERPRRSPAARANTWEDPYNPEAALPSETVIGSLRFYLIANGITIELVPERGTAIPSGAVVYTAKITDPSRVATLNPDGQTYSLTGRVVALANYPAARTPDTYPFGDNPYSITELYTQGLIPMWGVVSVTDFKLQPTKADAEQDANVVPDELVLLRSVPKISVELHEDIASDFRIVSVVPDQASYTSVANTLPTGASTVAKTKDLLVDGCFNPYYISSDTELYRPEFRRSTENGKFISYLPERTCPAEADGGPLSFTVTLETTRTPAEGEQKHRFSGKIYLRDYVDGQPTGELYNTLVRNHDYQFIIDLKELEFRVSVHKWRFGGKVHIDLE